MQGCGNCGTQSRTCDGTCNWPAWGACEGQGVCTPGAQDTQPCGTTGMEYRQCLSTCGWGPWSPCLM
jgi:hypothetical protein